MNNILEMLEKSTALYPEHPALSTGEAYLSYQEVTRQARCVGSALASYTSVRKPVIVFMDHSMDCIVAFLGVVYANDFYSFFNSELPDERLRIMADTLDADLVITDRHHQEQALQLFTKEKVVTFEELVAREEDADLLSSIRSQAIDTDPLYLNFTSGSTGVPKGVLIGQRSVIDFIPIFDDLFHITHDDILANQAPFDFDVSVKDIYSTLNVGATLVLVPREYFSEPARLVDFLDEQKVTTMIWAVSALCLLSVYKALDYKVPAYVNKILFSGEVMPYKHLKNYMDHMPHTMFVNLYGPTEITCNCLYHIIDPSRDYSTYLPAGKPFPNERVFLLKDDKLVTEVYEPGEICVTGTALAIGYYRQQSAQFRQNPLADGYHEMMYCTGDLAYLNEQGEFVFRGRKDFQIKYLGHRIELEEIDHAILEDEHVTRSCSLFDQEKEKLITFYIGDIDKRSLKIALMDRLPRFMIPTKMIQVEDMPLNKNGKIDRKALMEVYKNANRRHR